MADKYTVTDANGAEIKRGDVVIDFRGGKAIFLEVTRGKEYNGTAKVSVTTSVEFDSTHGFEYGSGREYYAGVYNLNVEKIVVASCSDR